MFLEDGAERMTGIFWVFLSHVLFVFEMCAILWHSNWSFSGFSVLGFVPSCYSVSSKSSFDTWQFQFEIDWSSLGFLEILWDDLGL